MILGVHKLQGRLMHVLDTEKTCQMTDTGEPAISGEKLVT